MWLGAFSTQRAPRARAASVWGRAGGTGTRRGGRRSALLQLGKLANLTMYGVASRSKHASLAEYGAIPIDYHTQDFVEVLRQAEPDGHNAVISGMTRMDYIRGGLRLLRQGGTLVSFDEPDSFYTLFRVLGSMMKVNLAHWQNRQVVWDIHLFPRRQKAIPGRWATLFQLLAEGQIKPVIEKKFPILEAAQANALLEGGQVTGNLVLVRPELL